MKITYVNYKKEFPAVKEGKLVFKRWFYIERFWSGKLISVGIKHHAIKLDFRGDLFFEMTGKRCRGKRRLSQK